MVRPALSPSHGSSDVNTSQVRASDNDDYEVPVLGGSMHPGGFIFVFQLKNGVGDGEIVFSTDLGIFPNVTVFPHSCIKVAQQQYFIAFGSL